MRFLLQVLTLLVLVFIGWDSPFRDTVAKMMPWSDIAPSRLAILRSRAAHAPPPLPAPAEAPPARPNLPFGASGSRAPGK